MEDCEHGLLDHTGELAPVPVEPHRRCFAIAGLALVGLATLGLAACTGAGCGAIGLVRHDDAIEVGVVNSNQTGVLRTPMLETGGIITLAQRDTNPDAPKVVFIPGDESKETPMQNAEKAAPVAKHIVKDGDVIEARGAYSLSLEDGFAVLLALSCIVGVILAVLRKTASSYKAMSTVEAAPPTQAVPEKPGTKPDGLRLVFDDHGTERTVHARYRPLGIKHTNRAPVVVRGFPINSYAKRGLGVQEGWKLTHIGDEDLKDSSDFDEVTLKLYNLLKDLPLWPLPLEFTEPQSSDPKTIMFLERPLGIEFSKDNPIEVHSVSENSPAEREGVQPGWKLTKIGEFQVTKNHGTHELFLSFREAIQPLNPVGEMRVVVATSLGSARSASSLRTSGSFREFLRKVSPSSLRSSSTASATSREVKGFVSAQPAGSGEEAQTLGSWQAALGSARSRFPTLLPR